MNRKAHPQQLMMLVIAPHPDDAELGAGGTMARYVEEGREVRVVALSDCRRSVPAGFERNVLRHEMEASLQSLGVESLGVRPFEVRTFPTRRQDILEYLVELNREHNPDLVLCPAMSDRHQDHNTVAMECLRAFQCSVWGFVLPWNTLWSDVRGFVRLEDRHVEAKVRAVSNYKSQQHRAYMEPEFIHGWARTVGVQARCRYAEAFEIMREVN